MVSNQIGSLLYQPTGHCSRPLVMHINDITADTESVIRLFADDCDTESEIRLFADDCVSYREIKDKEDTLKHTEGY